MAAVRWAGAVALVGILGAVTGCGAGSTTSAGSASAPSSIGLGTAASTAPTTTTTAASAATRARPTTTSGYRTYELCQGTCTGSVPAGLRRPLRLPSLDGGPCPVTIHADGPVSPSTSTEVGFSSITGSRWLGAEVTWSAIGGYSGPVLIRGGEIGGVSPLGFGEGRTPYDALELLDAGRVAPRVPGGGRAWITYTRVLGAGCYAYQVDGTSFDEVIVFRAV
jgi:hypothetical protein